MKKLFLSLMVFLICFGLGVPAYAAKVKKLLGQSCPEGQYVTGISSNATLICSSIVSEVTTYTMNCAKSPNDTGLEGTDPFDTSHANYGPLP